MEKTYMNNSVSKQVEHNGTTVTVNFPDERFNKNRLKKRFDSVGKVSSDGKEDFADLLLILSHTEIKLLAMLMKKRDYKTNVAILTRKELDTKEKNILNRGYKGLEDAGVIKRIHDEVYLFNPKYLISTEAEEKSIWERWKQVTKSVGS